MKITSLNKSQGYVVSYCTDCEALFCCFMCCHMYSTCVHKSFDMNSFYQKHTALAPTPAHRELRRTRGKKKS